MYPKIECMLTGRHVAGIYVNSVFNFLRNPHIFYHSDCLSLHSHQQCTRFFSPYLCQHLIFLLFLIIAILTSVRWYIIVILICISMMISNVEYLFMYLLAICMSPQGKCLFKMLLKISIFKSDCLVFFFLMSCMSSFHILNGNPSSEYDLQMLSPSE